MTRPDGSPLPYVLWQSSAAASKTLVILDREPDDRAGCSSLVESLAMDDVAVFFARRTRRQRSRRRVGRRTAFDRDGEGPRRLGSPSRTDASQAGRRPPGAGFRPGRPAAGGVGTRLCPAHPGDGAGGTVVSDHGSGAAMRAGAEPALGFQRTAKDVPIHGRPNRGGCRGDPGADAAAGGGTRRSRGHVRRCRRSSSGCRLR